VTATPCPGPCNRAHRDNPDHVPAIAGDPTWCPGCATGIAARLADLDDLVALLEAEIDGHRGQTTDASPVSGTRGRPSPSPAVDDVDEIVRTLEAWEAAYREHRRLPHTPTRAAEHRVMLTTAWLTRHLPGLLASDLARDFGLEITRLHRMAKRRTSTDPSKTRKPIPCPRCDTKALWHHDGDRHVECENCGRLLTLDEYDDLTRDLTNQRTA
jgi:hypothetical protein